ncbi:hypothetical protein SAMN02745163_03029 [Clostridium cavendishii DSM 21758]|uniref:Uncharacterized protein n=1 Tax=Clostridium cavendishii DSM 21758 TaxID=1121302 RepID=A0A1M6NV69_9CLOT|nr:hypothetical protein SAMN02745163_03029 [Clostridium cavendishii DSM 21758]
MKILNIKILKVIITKLLCLISNEYKLIFIKSNLIVINIQVTIINNIIKF